MKKAIFFSFHLFLFTLCFSQDEQSDTSRILDEVTIKAFEQNRKLSNSVATVKIIGFNNSDRYNKTSLVNGFNSIAGVRMEERSPGSYRINIRGSSLRSPFGVRNVKVYWNDIPITDPGGNTYFNQFAWNNFSYIEIFKGPAGSMYGAGTGGLVLLNNLDRWQPGASLEYVTGSNNLQNIFTSTRFSNKENKNQFTYAHNQTDGYRIQTNMRRDNFSWQSQLNLSDKQQISASLLFSDMYYQTPGALTLAEFTANPKAARPAGGGFPSAVNAKAAIFQKTITAGFTNVYTINSSLKNSMTLYGAFAQIKNSAIRNYERRNEPSFGGRTVFTYNKKMDDKSNFQLVAGSEFQKGYFNTLVSKNKNGNPDTLQTNDDINNNAFSYFAQVITDINYSWFITTGISANNTKVEIIRRNNYPVVPQVRSYKNEITPRLSVLKQFKNLNFLISAAKGFSPPTTSEVLPSTGVISTFLDAEYGWNYEFSIQAPKFSSGKLKLELTVFSFNLKNALVQRRDVSGADFFVNAGNTKQQGIEFHADYKGSIGGRIFRHFTIGTDATLNNFRYGNFIKGTDDFSDKKLPSVPSSVLSILGDLYLKKGIYFRTTYYGSSFIYLNDANTAKAEPYHLLGIQLGYKKKFKNQFELNFYTGADNLLNDKYSLGNDINAAANRFYNAAPERNYYAGLSFQWIKSKAH